MNTRLATAAAALAVLQIAAIASQSADEPQPFDAGTPVAAVANGVLAWTADGVALPQPLTGLSGAVDVCFAPDGTLFVSDEGSNSVLRCDAGAQVLATLGAGSDLAQPAGLALGPGGALYVASRGTDSVLVFDADGAPAGEFGADAGLSAPWGLAFDAAGRLAVASSGSDEVLVFDPSGARVATLGSGALSSPRGLCFGRDGRLYVASHDAGEVVVLDASGSVVDSFDGGGALGQPVGVAFGPDGLLYVAASGMGTVYALAADGSIAGSLPAAAPASGLSGLAFAPQLVRGSLKGVFERPGDPKHSLKESGLFAFRPGALPVTLQLDDPMGDAANTIGAVLGWQGWVTTDDGGTRSFDAQQIGAAAAQLGLSSLHLDLKGDALLAPTDAPGWQPRKGGGPLQAATPLGVIDADVKLGKRVN